MTADLAREAREPECPACKHTWPKEGWSYEWCRGEIKECPAYPNGIYCAAALDGAPAAPDGGEEPKPIVAGSEDEPDWMPAQSAMGLPEGYKANGSTGQEWVVRAGRWERIRKPKLQIVAAPAAPDGLVPADMLALTKKANEMVKDCSTLDARELGAVVLAQWFFENWPKFSSFIEGLAALPAPTPAPEMGVMEPEPAQTGDARLVEKEERDHLRTLDERDAAEEALSQAYYLVTGRSPEWSNMFGHKEALEEIDDAVSLLRQSARLAPPQPAQDAGLITDVQALARRAENWMANGVIKKVLSEALSPAEIKMLNDVIAALKAAPVPVEVVALANELLTLAEKGASRKWTQDDLEWAMLVHIHRSPHDSPFDGGTLPMSKFLTFCRDHAETICRALTGQAAPKGETPQAPPLCSDCPPVGYPTDKTRCAECPRFSAPKGDGR